MITDTPVLVIWERLGYNAYMYEIVPGFIANALTIWIVNHFTTPDDAEEVSTPAEK
jgi:sodium/proline symporter